MKAWLALLCACMLLMNSVSARTLVVDAGMPGGRRLQQTSVHKDPTTKDGKKICRCQMSGTTLVCQGAAIPLAAKLLGYEDTNQYTWRAMISGRVDTCFDGTRLVKGRYFESIESTKLADLCSEDSQEPCRK